MCYAIPGKVIDINDKIITVDYFGEQKMAKNDFFELAIGNYVYAQGGFIIQKVSASEALPVLETYQELFFKLQEIDSKLTQRRSKNLYQIADTLRQRYHGNSCCIHGILEFSNYCRNDCLYCGLRHSNRTLVRYRMSLNEIVDSAEFAVSKLGFKALVLQSGEDTWYDEGKFISIVSRIKERCPSLLILSIGERETGLYERLYQIGCRGVLLRFETSNESLYKKMRPAHILKERLELINRLQQIGYFVMSGFLIGLPGQTKEDLHNDIELMCSLGVDMFSFGPFVPHPQTPLADVPAPPLELALKTIAQARLMNPKAKILVTTSLETLDREDGLRLGLLSGANSLMIDVTPLKYQQLYELYPNRAGVNQEISERIDSTIKLLHSIGRAPTDLGL